MSSLYIPELVTGIPLFVPSDRNFFSIEADSLPNGDPALVVHGDVGRSYRAYQAAQTLSPNVFLEKRSEFSLSFWIKSTPVSLSAIGYRSDSFIMGTMNNSFTPQAHLATASLTSSSGAPYRDSVWSLVAYAPSAGSTNSIGFHRVASIGAGSFSGIRAHYVDMPLSDVDWNFVVISAEGTSSAQTAKGPITSFVNLVEYPGTVLTAGSSVFDPAINSGQHFSLGGYSDAASINGRDGEYRIAKICFHDHILDQTEREQLYYSMTDV